MSDSVVYLVAVRTSEPRSGEEVQAAMAALNEAGLLPRPPFPSSNFAVAWHTTPEALSSADLETVGLDPESARKVSES